MRNPRTNPPPDLPPITVWLTGLSGAGKTTLSTGLHRQLCQMGLSACVLDGDRLRRGLSRDLGFSAEDRTENIRRVAEVSRLMNDAGLIVIAALISPYRRDREMAREIVGEERFRELYVSTPLDVCERRDSKGLYRLARAGKLPLFTGVSDPYEPPESPWLSISGNETPVEAAIASILERLQPLART